MARRTAGSYTLTSASWTNLDTGLDLTLAAQVGDVIEVGMSGRYDSEAYEAYLDVASLVSGSPVNYWGTDAAENGSSQGLLAWRGPVSISYNAAGGALRTIVSGDLASGLVTLRLRYRLNSAGSKTFYGTTTIPLIWWAKNLGPQDST